MSDDLAAKYDALVAAVDAYVEPGTLSVTLPNGYVVVRDGSKAYRNLMAKDAEMDRSLRLMGDVAKNMVFIADSVRLLRARLPKTFEQEGDRE